MLQYIAKATPALTPLPGMSRILSTLLNQRGISTPEQAEAFLHPSAARLHDPLLMQNMAEAVERIRSAIAAGERITVYGDYDVDGVTASSILRLHLQTLGGKVTGYIPSRHDEGYGLNLKAVGNICGDTDLIISVDCGITSVNEVAYVKGMGRDIIVTDHHQLPPELPDCLCINPQMGEYPFRKLCGAGVVMKLVQALSGTEALDKYYDLAALGTIADLVPLLDENRTFAQLGLAMMNAKPRAGIAALARVSGLTGKPLSAGNVAFQIAPRINAGGRLEDANQCVELLTCSDDMRVQQLAERLDAENTRRKQLETDIFAQAESMLAATDLTKARALIVCGQGWNPGVIGLVASRLTEKYHYPSIVLSDDGTDSVGSCRSIKGVDIFEALSSCRDLYKRFGGHPQAAGLTLPTDKLPEFSRRLNEYLRDNIPADVYLPSLEYDLDAELPELTLELAKELSALAPTGFGNAAPVIRASARVLSAQAVGSQGAHMKLVLGDGPAKLGGIAFRMGGMAGSVSGTQQDVLFSLGVNEYMGREMAQAEVKALKPVTPAQALQEDPRRRELMEQNWRLGILNGIDESSAPVRSVTLDEIAAHMAKNAQGLFMHASGAAAAKKALARLASVCDIGRIDVSYGNPEDKRCFNALCVCAEGVPPTGYAYYVAMDGAIDASYAARLAASNVVPMALDGAKSALTCPGDDVLRGIYSFVRANELRLSGAGNAVELASWVSGGMGIAPGDALTGLCVLRQLALVRFEDAAPGCGMLPFRRVELCASAIYRRLNGLEQ